MSSFRRRLLRAAMLDSEIYEEVEADHSSITQAVVVVLAACTAIGVGRWIESGDAGIANDQRLFQVVLSVIEPLVLWVGGSALSLMVGTTFFRGPETESDFMEVLRTMGFAFTPSLLRIFVFVPPAWLGLGVDFVARAWVLAAVVVALRQALDFTTIRAIGTFGVAQALLWLILWGLSVAPLPF